MNIGSYDYFTDIFFFIIISSISYYYGLEVQKPTLVQSYKAYKLPWEETITTEENLGLENLHDQDVSAASNSNSLLIFFLTVDIELMRLYLFSS